MMTNTENPTGETAFVRVAKSAVQGGISAVIFVITFYSIGYFFGYPTFFGISFSISQVIVVTLVGATIGASAYLRYVWALIIITLPSVVVTLFYFAYPGWRFWEFGFISASVFVLLLMIAAVAWGPLRSPHPRVGRVTLTIVNWFFRKLTTPTPEKNSAR